MIPKYRAWDKEGNKWFVNLPVVLGVNSQGELECFNDGIICQFTGLKDKNGKEIYAGDIVKRYKAPCEQFYPEDYVPIHEVVYQDDAFWLLPINGRDGNRRAVRNRPLEIIGNKWENPELLEQP